MASSLPRLQRRRHLVPVDTATWHHLGADCGWLPEALDPHSLRSTFGFNTNLWAFKGDSEFCLLGLSCCALGAGGGAQGLDARPRSCGRHACHQRHAAELQLDVFGTCRHMQGTLSMSARVLIIPPAPCRVPVGLNWRPCLAGAARLRHQRAVLHSWGRPGPRPSPLPRYRPKSPGKPLLLLVVVLLLLAAVCR